MRDGHRHRASSRCGFLLLMLGALLAGGCRQKPRAPLLQDEPVYHNPKQHVRFLAPEGWTQHAKADVPAGPVEGAPLLVHYIHWNGDDPALLELSLVDLPETADLPTYLSGQSFGAKQWRVALRGEPVEAGGVAGQRIVLQTSDQHGDRTKEVTAFHRANHWYLFTGVFSTSDTAARDQIRQAIQSIVWD